MKAELLIIHRPERQRPLHRAGFALITIVAWTFWISLWLPALTLIAWLLGLGDAYVQLNAFHPLHAAHDLDIIPMLACVCALAFIAWAFYNRVRFSKTRRRCVAAVVDVAHMAKAMGACVQTAEAMRARRRSVVHVSDTGYLYVRDPG